MSEYETTDLGGDPVEFEFVEGGTYERGVIRSTADRQQIRRDAETWIGLLPDTTIIGKLARHCLALLTELEQAERWLAAERIEHGDTSLHLRDEYRRANAAEARLANVPALVEALRHYANTAHWDHDQAHGESVWTYDLEHNNPTDVATEALAAWLANRP